MQKCKSNKVIFDKQWQQYDCKKKKGLSKSAVVLLFCKEKRGGF